MTYLINPATLPFTRDRHAEAIDAWRLAERLVVKRWEQYTAAPRADRPAAFYAYIAALDAEEAAAAELQQPDLRKAA